VATEQTTERVQTLRHEFRSWLDTIDIKNLIFIDETGVNQAMTRLYGRCSEPEEESMMSDPELKVKPLPLLER